MDLLLERVDPLQHARVMLVGNGTSAMEARETDMSHMVFLVPRAGVSTHQGMLALDTRRGHVHGSVHRGNLTGLSIHPALDGDETGAAELEVEHRVHRETGQIPALSAGSCQAGHPPAEEDAGGDSALRQVGGNNGSASPVLRQQQRRDPYVSGRSFCNMHLVADYQFFSQVAKLREEVAVSKMIEALVYANEIFGNTAFTNVPDRVQLQLRQVTVYTADTDPFTSSEVGTPASADDLLKRIQQRDHSEYCLMHLFTNVDFVGGVVGLAYIGRSSGAGICEDSLPSTNCGFTTFSNFGKLQPPWITSTVFTHEVGHNFGADHDKLAVTNGGFFIMFAETVDGSMPNNKKFSATSIADMSTVIRARGGCFTAKINECGNGLQEAGEPCDCGSADQCASTLLSFDRCCTSSCALKSGASCSPRMVLAANGQATSDGMCCTSACGFQRNGTVCEGATSCRRAATCDGAGKCLPGSPQPANRLCDPARENCDGGKCAGLCNGAGECSRSVCELWTGYQSVEVAGRDTSCFIHCRLPGSIVMRTTDKVS